ncbi:MAG: helix-turn-helix domain-containing protein [Myxococcota bacterium]
MTTEHSNDARNWKEGRRLRAWELKQDGWKQRDIAKALGVTEGAVSQWLKRAREDGVEALMSRKAAGPTPRLTEAQLRQLPTMLRRGTEHHGFQGRWTCRRVSKVIERRFGVHYHPSHVSRLLRRIGCDIHTL